MKGHKAHHHRKEGGKVQETPESGHREYEMDLKDAPESRDNAHKIDKEAEERKAGGRAKRKHGGSVTHHEKGKHLGHAKHVGPVMGAGAMHHAGRKPRAAGGSNMNPLSSAHKGTLPPHQKEAKID
jgi:hypothetical protein